MELFTAIGMTVVFLAAIYAAVHVLSVIGDVVGPWLNDLMARRRRASNTDAVIAKGVHVAYKNDPYGVFFQPAFTVNKDKLQNAYWGFYDRKGVLYSFESEGEAGQAALNASNSLD